MGFTKFAITAGSQKVHSRGAAVHGRQPSPKVTTWRSLCPCRSHTSAMMTARGCAPSNPVPPCAHFSVGGAPKNRGLFLQNLLYVSSNFHTIGPFSERVVIFQVSEAVYDAKMCH